MIEKFVAEPEKIREELKSINENSEMKVDMLISLKTICEILEGLGYGPSNFIMKEEAVERQVLWKDKLILYQRMDILLVRTGYSNQERRFLGLHAIHREGKA